MTFEQSPAPERAPPDLEREDHFRGSDEEPARAALVWLRNRHGGTLRSLARTWCGGDPEMIDEALQELDLRLWQRRGQFYPARSRWLTWARTILKNLLVDAHRRRARRTTHSRPGGDSPVADPLDQVPGREPAPDWRLRTEELQRDVNDCLNRLPANEREALQRQMLDGLSLQEIADRAGVPRATIGTRCHRAQKRLRACLQDKGYGGGEQ